MYSTSTLTGQPRSSSIFRHPLTPLSTNKPHCTPGSFKPVTSAAKSVFSDILVIPTPPQPRRVEKTKCARVLTSAESRAFLEEKEKKMKQQQEEKEEREEKRNAKKQEKQLKAREREAKKAERQRKVQEKAKEN